MRSPTRNNFQDNDRNFYRSYFILFVVSLTWALLTPSLFAASPSIEFPFSPIITTYGNAAQNINVFSGFIDDLTPDDGLIYTVSSDHPEVVNVSTVNSTTGLLTLTFGTPGTATITLTATDQESLSTSSILSVTVNKANQTITLTPPLPPASVTYGDPNFSLSATAPGGTVTFAQQSGPCNLTGNTVNITGTGNCVLSASQAGNANYDPVTLNPLITITIKKKQLSVTPDNQTRIYGDPNPALTVSYNGFVGTDNVSVLTKLPTLTTTATQNSNVGTYTISAAGATSGNYSFKYNPGTLEITQRPLTITAENKTRFYGDPNPPFTLSYNGFYSTDNESVLNIKPTATTNATTTSSVGSYDILLSGGSDNNYNYTSLIKGILTVNQANITAQVDNVTREYGQPNPSFTFSYPGLKNGETESVIDAPPTADGSMATLLSSPAGYPIPCSGGNDDNYNVTACHAGTLTIIKAKQSVTFGGLSTKIYGDDPFQVTATATSNLTPTFTTTGNCAVVGDIVTITGAGNCTVIASQEGDINYSPAPPASQSFTINKKELTITADNKSRPYGDPNPLFTFSYAGFVLGENESVLKVLPTGETPATFTSEVNSYSIVPQGADDENYFFTYIDGRLDVIQADITAKVDDTQRVYSAPNPVFTFAYAGLKNNETSEVIDIPPIANGSSVDEFTPLGNYPIPCSGGTDHNYRITDCYTGLLMVTKANAAPGISSISPSITTTDQEVIINISVPPQSPATASPSGNVTISDGTESCQTTIEQGKCSITFKTLGTKSLRAIYEGNDYFNKNMSAPTLHVVRETGVAVNPVSVQAVEAGNPGIYTLSLLTFPRGLVEVTAWGGKQTEVSLNGIDYAQSVIITLADMNPQKVYVRGTDDILIEGLHQGSVIHAITGKVIDPKYPSSLGVASTLVNLIDNDPGVIISPTNLSMIEGTLASTYAIRFSTPPAQPVTLTLSPDIQATVRPDKIIFMPDISALEPHIVYVNAIDEYFVEGIHQGTISHQISIGDGENYLAKLQLDQIILNLMDPPRVVPLAVTTLELVVQIEGDGEVQSDVTGIHCHPSDRKCVASYPQTTKVRLTPIPASGYYFSSWGGHSDCVDNEVWMVNSLLCIAYFKKIETSTEASPLPSQEESITSSEPSQSEEQPGFSEENPKSEEKPKEDLSHPVNKEDTTHVVELESSPPPVQPVTSESPSSVQEPSEEVITPEQTTIEQTIVTPPQEEVIEPRPSPPLPQHVLLEITVVGGGKVQYEGTICESACLREYPQGTWVALVASPHEGFIFNGWNGDCQGNETTTNLEMATTKQCFAQFIPKEHVVSTPVEEEVFPCPPEKTLDWICNAQGALLHQDLTIHSHGNLSNAVVVKSIDNQGWASNLVIEPAGKVTGGIITGYINNQGMMADFEFRGIAITGGKLAGKITNTSEVGGYFENVEFVANSSVKGGRLGGRIKGDPEFPTRLEEVILLSGSHLSGVTLGNKVTVQENVVIDVPQPSLPTLGTASAYNAQGKPVETHSKFSGGIAVNRQERIFNIKAKIQPLSSTVVNIKGNITVDPLHLGQTAELILYVSYQRTLKDKFIYFMVDCRGKLLPWDEDPETLVAFQEGVTLDQEMTVSLYKGILTTEGRVNIYFGYRLADGTMITSSRAMELNVTR